MKLAFILTGLKPGLQAAIISLDAVIRATLPDNEERLLAQRALQDVASRCVLSAEFEKVRQLQALAAADPLKAELIGEE